MAGIYIHIPFCNKRCTYCDFYTEVVPQLIPTLVNSIVKEFNVRKNYLPIEPINTIYFGGGTPSTLNKEHFLIIFDAINSLYNVAKNAEITFEANPDDLTVAYLESLSSLPFNRISIGIQSFDDADLKRVNRRHTANEAIEAVRNAQKFGFTNISIDLIYGLPFQTLEGWNNQLETALQLGVQHISSYGLTYEEGTVLWNQRENNEINTVDDETMNDMYLLLIDKMSQNGFESYEISNFSLPNYRSRHNTSYWKQESYIGIGPSAHSYNLSSRQSNIASTSEYIKALDEDTTYFELEELSANDLYNDFVMVSLRTSDGLDLQILEENFGTDLKLYCLKNIKTFIDSKKVVCFENKLRLTAEGIQISNIILAEIMKVE